MDSIYDIYGWFYDPVGWAAPAPAKPAANPADQCHAQAQKNNPALASQSCQGHPCTAMPCTSMSECGPACGWDADYVACILERPPCKDIPTINPSQGAEDLKQQVQKGGQAALDSTGKAVTSALGPISKFFEPCNLGGTPGKPLFQLPVPCWFAGLLTVLVLLVLIRH